jgi:hypothetical protein
MLSGDNNGKTRILVELVIFKIMWSIENKLLQSIVLRKCIILLYSRDRQPVDRDRLVDLFRNIGRSLYNLILPLSVDRAK